MPDHIRQEPKVLVSTENLTEQEWLAYRRQGIGGSDVAAILGISPFRTARDLYDDKLNIASAVDDTGNWVALEMGHLLEPLVAQIFTKKTGLEVFQIKKMFQHPQYPFMLADVDYFVRLPNGEIALLEIKTTNYNAKDHWWKDGEEYVPVYYETQGRHYMAVMDMDEILAFLREKTNGLHMPTKLLCFVFSLICEYSCLFILHQLQAKVSFVSIILLIISTGVIVVLAPCNNAEIHCSSLELQSIKKSVHRRLALYSLLIAIFIVLKPILANTLIIAEFAVAVLVALSRLGVGIQ